MENDFLGRTPMRCEPGETRPLMRVNPPTRLLTTFAFAIASLTVFAADRPRPVFGVASYGTKGDGKTNDGAAIQKAIDACAKAGGGTVNLPSGNFLTGTIVLKSNVTLHLSH